MAPLNLFQVLILAIVQGLAELLPVSSSAHVIVAEKLMHLDPASPDMTVLLVMLHTGTMFAVIVYFWNRWKLTYFRSANAFWRVFIRIAWATVLTGVIGYPIKKVIEHVLFKHAEKAEIEQLFGRLDLVAIALFFAGLLILIAGLRKRSKSAPQSDFVERRGESGITMRHAGVMGAVQGLSLPFRGFSRSGTTISAGLLAGAHREAAETFSFALAVVLTPGVVGYEVLRLIKESHAAGSTLNLHDSAVNALIGMVFSFLAGLVGLKWLSSWLETGKWYLFGIYCILASAVIFYLHTKGY